MILGFKTEINGEQTYFIEKIFSFLNKEMSLPILFTPKIHTVRKGHRWKPGMSIQMATGVRTKNYRQFNKDIPLLSTCISTQSIIIIHNVLDAPFTLPRVRIYIDNNLITYDTGSLLAINDGFSLLTYFLRFFNKDFDGQIIHWTDFKY